MLNGTIINNSNCKPENSHVARYESVIIDAIHSQAFFFVKGMGFIRKDNGKRLCACGCGQVTQKSQNYKGYNKYINGHNTRGKTGEFACAFGYRHTEEAKKKISDAQKGNQYSKGRKHTKKFKQAMIGNERFKGYEGNLGYKHTKEHKQKMSLLMTKEGNHQWRGGISCEPYCDVWLDKDFKNDIFERDGYRCQNPDCRHTSDNLPLHRHHIDYDKKNCHPWNLITLCNSCNARANFKRECWTKFYQNLMTEKYGYQYN